MNFKKSMLALEALMGIILSVLAVFLVLYLFSNIFFQNDTNLKIAKDNANSIKDFIEFSNAKYYDRENCYTMLRLDYLENFQNIKKEPFYFYVIAPERIYIFDINILNDVLNGEIDLSSEEARKYYRKYMSGEFNFLGSKLLDIKMESFTAWDQFQNSLINLIPFFEKNDNKIIDLENSEYIILSPIFEQTNLGSFNFISPDIKNIDQNVLLALNFERIRTEEGFWAKILNSQSGIYYNSFYLVYESKKTLFPLYSKLSELYIQKNLCEIEEYKRKYLKRFETKDDYLNFLNLEEAYILDLLNDEKNIIKSFKLNLDNNGNILCKEGEKKKNGDKIEIKTNFSYAILEFDNNLFFTENKYNIVYDEYGKIHYVYVYASVDYQSLNVPFKFGRYYDDYMKYFGDNKDIDNIYKISERLYEKAKKNKILLILNDDSNLKFHENDCFKLNNDFKTCDVLINRETDASIINHFSKFKISDEILNCDKLLKKLDSSSKENFEESVKLFSIDYEKNELIFSKIIQEKEKNLFIADLFKKSDLILSEDDLNWFGEGDVKKSDRYEIYKLGKPYLNECEEEICNYFVYDISEKKVLYYDNLIYGSFVEFDVSLLFKNNRGEILFNGKTGAFREFERNGLKFYRVYISINDKMNLDFIISEIQMKKILLEYFEK